MIYFNNPASIFNITILINLSPKWPVPKQQSHTPRETVKLFAVDYLEGLSGC